jgi:hypothetical protein
MNDAKIYLVDSSQKRLMPMNATLYLTEDELQTYLADYADLLPGDQINPEAPRRWLLVAREMGVPGTELETGRWSLDHLFLDQDGTPTFVECKRASDTRTRREVVAQMLDYAANGITYWSLDRLRQAAAETARQRGIELDESIMALLRTDAPADVENFWKQVEEKLRMGSVRLLFVVDEAPRELRRLVEFLNQKMADIEVLIVEIKQYQGEGHVALAPRVIGATEATRSQKIGDGVAKVNLTPETFLATATPIQQELAHYVWQAAKQYGYLVRWRPTAYTVRARHPVSKQEMTFLYGYRSHVDFYFAFLALPENMEAELRHELLATGLYSPSGQQTLAGATVDMHNKQQVCDSLDLIFQRVTSFVATLKGAGD